MLKQLKFDNRFVKELPADTQTGVGSRLVFGAGYSKVVPVPAPKPQLVVYSKEMAQDLGLSEKECRSAAFADVFAGNRALPGMSYYAVCYGGHQFGTWAGQLGDGRVINLGEAVTKDTYLTLQLKGAGPTPYSRTADGFAVLRSSLREFLCSEAMHHLGVPTTRALSLVLTGGVVIRDMFYDGNPKTEPGAIVCRVAPSFTRFGNFEIFAARGDTVLLAKLVDFTIKSDFSHLGEPSLEVYIAWFKEICKRTAELIVHWQRVGFVHGVMNTDNMSILGLTIDYGPYGWMENYDPAWTPNTTDADMKRYCYGNQPHVGYWNLVQLANAIYPLVQDAELLQEALGIYTTVLESGMQRMMADKLGLAHYEPEVDTVLEQKLMELFQAAEVDMTIFYRRLAHITTSETMLNAKDDDLIAPLLDAYYVPVQLTAEYKAQTALWIRDYIRRVRKDGISDVQRRSSMNAVNPKYVLRNYLAQLAIDDVEAGDYALVNELLDVFRKPYDEQPGREKFAEKRPDWARQRAGCSMLSCSS